MYFNFYVIWLLLRIKFYGLVLYITCFFRKARNARLWKTLNLPEDYPKSTQWLIDTLPERPRRKNSRKIVLRQHPRGLRQEEDWSNMMFGDECPMGKSKDPHTLRVFDPDQEKYHKDVINGDPMDNRKLIVFAPFAPLVYERLHALQDIILYMLTSQYQPCESDHLLYHFSCISMPYSLLLSLASL